MERSFSSPKASFCVLEALLVSRVLLKESMSLRYQPGRFTSNIVSDVLCHILIKTGSISKRMCVKALPVALLKETVIMDGLLAASFFLVKRALYLHDMFLIFYTYRLLACSHMSLTI